MKNLLEVKLVSRRKEERNDNNSTYTRSRSNLLAKNILAAIKKYRIFNKCGPGLAVVTWKLIATMLSYTKQ
jgi:hypothetical protein